MKTCSNCGKQNHDDAGYCYRCRNPFMHTMPVAKRSVWSKLPSWAWIFIGLGVMAVFILIMIGGFWSLANIEGFASVIFLAIGIFYFGVFSGRRPGNMPVVRAIMIGFFALMGATIDQTGNLVYNKPVEICLCTPKSTLERSTITSHPLPGRTDMTQNFICYLNGEPVKQIDMFAVLGIRFLEYMILAYLLIGLRWIIWKYKSRTS